MKRILIIGCLILWIFSCKTEENPIPSYPVYLNLDLTFEDKVLKAIPAYKEFTNRNINIALGERIGYGGVLVVHTLLDEYKAFDRACPYEASANVTVQVDEEILYAVCPKCGTKYEVGLGSGAPDGVGRHGLRPYNTMLNGSKLIVGK
jgi:nitrite reductase/ring-hydroxylating ferredoxin subunit